MRCGFLKHLVLGAVVSAGHTAAANPANFERIAEHVYRLSAAEGGPNVGIVVTGEGVLIIDPPPQAELQSTLEALAGITAAPVRWVVHTSVRRMRTSSWEHFHAAGAVLLNSRELDRLAFPGPAPEAPKEAVTPVPPAAPTPAATPVPAATPGGKAVPQKYPRFVFESEARLFPDNLEVRIMAVRHKALTAGDVLVCIPQEKVMCTGDLYLPATFPEIDKAADDGDPLGWMDGMKMAISAVPILKSAMPQPREELPPVPPELQKTPEEMFLVIPGRGPISNLREMADLLELAQRLRQQVARAVAGGREIQELLASGAWSEFRRAGNLQSYAARLHEALAAGK